LLFAKFVHGWLSEIDQVHRFAKRDIGGRRTFFAHDLERSLPCGDVPGGPALCE
jgi:hypothetical protein